jgi:hypothetical protein
VASNGLSNIVYDLGGINSSADIDILLELQVPMHPKAATIYDSSAMKNLDSH